MKQTFRKLKRKLKSAKGMTLGEMLVATLIIVLASGILASVGTLALRQYRKSVRSAEAQVLCSTLRDMISDELAYTTDVKTNTSTHQVQYFYSKKGYRESTFSEENTDSGGYGYITIRNYENNEEYEDLLGSGAYSEGLLAKVERITYEQDNCCFTVELSIGYDGEEYYGQQFQVLNANKVSG